MSAHVWVVYPSDSRDAMVATGVCDDEGKARQIVEGVLEIAGNAAYGVVVGHGIHQDVCRRADGGGYKWAPLFAEAG